MPSVQLDGQSLTPEMVARVAGGAPVVVDEATRERMQRSAVWFAEHGSPDVLGSKWSWLVGKAAPQDRGEQARCFVLGHCAGVGEPLSIPLARALMVVRANVLATGLTGARPEILDGLVTLLNHGITPVIPGKGAVGAAGSAQLAHMARVLCGWGGEAWRDGVRMPASQALDGIEALVPTPKEALSLVNGASLTTAMAALATHRMRRLLHAAEAAASLTFEVVRADLGCLDPSALSALGHAGPQAVADRLRDHLHGSELVGHDRRPDPFSIRCVPQVLGAAWSALGHAEAVVSTELNAAVDNPVVVPGQPIAETGNFHGAAVAAVLEQLKVAAVQVASIAERRVFRLTYGQLSGLPSFLAPDTGLHSGLMLAQYTAASLVSECKVLSHPGAVDSLPTVQHREDHVSMGPVAGRSALRILDAAMDVVAIELLCAAQGLDFHLQGRAVDEDGQLVAVAPRQPGAGTRRVYAAVREFVSFAEHDRVLHPDLEAMGRAVRAGRFDEVSP
ncbi:MAG: histidine ammonia-lyase [Deltaproteobacteria bacterium]|nr:MAG: histidine ammonia-lyase [Deltaproteobacteria bacterium]